MGKPAEPNKKNRISSYIQKNFSVDISPSYLEKLLLVGRVLFAIIILHRSIDMFGFSIVSENHELIQEVTITTGLIGLALLLGLCTPVVLLIYIFSYCVEPKFSFNLFHQMAIILSWGLIFLGAGKSYSLDSWIRNKFSKTQAFYDFIYKLSVNTSSGIEIAYVRFVMLLMYWGTTVSAMSYHFYDPLWLNNRMLQLAFTTPYLNDFFAIFETVRNNFPYLFDYGLQLAMILQVIWELFMIPLMQFKWGRVFVCFQGVGFLVLCLICFNLGYLPITELVLWSVVFAYPNVFKENKFDEKSLSPEPKSFLPVFTKLAMLAFTTFFIINTGNIIIKNPNGVKKINKGALRIFHRTFAQDRVNVFNKTDLNMGAFNFSLYELDKNGEKIRQVPFQNSYGARLDYLRNDLLYFQHSLRWQRLPFQYKFEIDKEDDSVELTDHTKKLLYKVGVLDFCLNGMKTPSIYRWEIYRRDMIKMKLSELNDFHDIEKLTKYKKDDTERFVYGWTKPEEVMTGKIGFDTRTKKLIESVCNSTYDLGPGHFSELDELDEE